MKHITGFFTTIFSSLIIFFVIIPTANAGNSSKQQSLTERNDPPAGKVEVVVFRGQSAVDNKKIELFCKIESNCCYNIIVERSSNGKKFTAISTISDNKPLAEFALTDNNPLRNTNYYRLKMADNKGNISYSKTMVVQLYKSDDLSMVSVTPNTALKDIHINVQLKNRAYIVMKVTDENGKEVIKRKGVGSEGINMYELEGTGKIIPGNYFLEVLVNSKDLLSMPLIKKG